MSIYLLQITEHPIAGDELVKIFPELVKYNQSYADFDFKGMVNYGQNELYELWVTLMQLNYEHVSDDSLLTVVWAPDPFDSLFDEQRTFYKKHQKNIEQIVNFFMEELGAVCNKKKKHGGHVIWILSKANTTVLANILAKARRQQLVDVVGGGG